MIADGLSEIEGQDPPDPTNILDEQRLIESIERSGLFDDLGSDQLVTTIFASELQCCRIARRKVDDKERNNRDTEQGRNDQKETFDEIPSHQREFYNIS